MIKHKIIFVFFYLLKMSEQPINETEQVESMDIVPEEVPLSEEDQAAQDTMRDMDELVKIKEQVIS